MLKKQKDLARPVNQRLNNKRIKAVGLSNESNKPENNGRISEAKIPSLENPIRTPPKEANTRIQSNVIVPSISGDKTPKAIPIKENNPNKQRQTVQARQQQEIAAARRIADDRARRNQIAQKQAAEQKQRQTVQARQQQEIAAARRIADDRGKEKIKSLKNRPPNKNKDKLFKQGSSRKSLQLGELQTIEQGEIKSLKNRPPNKNKDKLFKQGSSRKSLQLGELQTIEQGEIKSLKNRPQNRNKDKQSNANYQLQKPAARQSNNLHNAAS